MQRLDYQLTIQRNLDVRAEFKVERETAEVDRDSLDQSYLEPIRGYLPLLQAQGQHSRELIKNLGKLLYQTLFSGRVRGRFEYAVWPKVEQRAYRLALHLTIEEGVAPEIAALPWEFLFYPDRQIFFGTDSGIAFSYGSAHTHAPMPEPLSVDTKLRIVLVRLQPPGMAPVALTRIRNYLAELAEQRPHLSPPIVVDEHVEPLALEAKFAQIQPHVIHILAHGKFDHEGTRFALVDDTGQNVRWYGDGSLSDVFRRQIAEGAPARLVILQACEGGKVSNLASFAVGATLLAQRLPAVVAMRYPITNEVGWTFAERLYEGLVSSDDLDVAVQTARRTLAKMNTAAQALDDHASRDFAAPMLWMRSGAFQVFQEKQVSSIPRNAQPDMTALRIATPDGQLYEADVLPDLLVGQLTRAFRDQWHLTRPAPGSPQRYSLRRATADNANLDPERTLREAGVTSGTSLMLVSEPLAPNAPIGLTIEDAAGQRFVTAVALNTPIRRLAAAFLQAPTDGLGAVVEALNSSLDAPPRQLDLDASLYEQGVGDDALLRIYRAQQ